MTVYLRPRPLGLARFARVGSSGKGTLPVSDKERFQTWRETIRSLLFWKSLRLDTRRPGRILPLSTDSVSPAGICFVYVSGNHEWVFVNHCCITSIQVSIAPVLVNYCHCTPPTSWPLCSLCKHLINHWLAIHIIMQLHNLL